MMSLLLTRKHLRSKVAIFGSMRKNREVSRCGFGEVLRLMQMRMSDACTFWGYDISPQAIENPQGLLRNSGWPKQIHECCYYHNANGYLKEDGAEA